MGKTVVGRDVELTIIDRFLDGLRSGSATLIIEGMAGIGKTTMLQTAVRRAEGTARGSCSVDPHRRKRD